MKAKVLKLLREINGQYISGEKISSELSCSRTMVWKYIKALREDGYVIEAVSNKGYKLVSISNHLSDHEIRSRLGNDHLFKEISYHEEVESTQNIAQKLINQGAGSGTVVIANEQTSGRGRLGRDWFSPKDKGIWMSLILKPEITLREAPQLTLLAAVAVTRAISSVCSISSEIKWPNDILVDGKKVCGILTEMQADPDRIKSVIIGIGINVNQTDFPSSIANIATSLAKARGEQVERSELIIQILNEFQWLYEAYLAKGFSFIKPLWEVNAISIGKKIVATTAQGRLTGIAEGINDEGVLILRDDNGKVHHIYSGDITIPKD
ncbi:MULTISPECIES: biotin--[acetyl-CoA-carboxylase] ligase [Bacillaceae]|uniref:Bifunctional ligase/repressor BirA n=1 Tax=Evansella alkalicola TaxID=745819 RepID=A0ABS6JZA8_9BACI|nr:MULTISPECIES: biotin--[acetyl-CoA-carboxylase] ligase [Bacillaceae]MBU9723919.1 biotin--[acetyl-CoA-carboxylase] ligase [Bacillus alkalicola]